jgi:hypothetical protein
MQKEKVYAPRVGEKNEKICIYKLKIKTKNKNKKN